MLCAIAIPLKQRQKKKKNKQPSLCVSNKVITSYRQEIALINSCELHKGRRGGGHTEQPTEDLGDICNIPGLHIQSLRGLESLKKKKIKCLPAEGYTGCRGSISFPRKTQSPSFLSLPQHAMLQPSCCAQTY